MLVVLVRRPAPGSDILLTFVPGANNALWPSVGVIVYFENVFVPVGLCVLANPPDLARKSSVSVITIQNYFVWLMIAAAAAPEEETVVALVVNAFQPCAANNVCGKSPMVTANYC
jgi:hypothetical protein